jgi:hypothetical protein
VTNWMIARHRVAIAGLVVDGITNKPMAGAHVEIIAKPAAYERKLALLFASLEGPGADMERTDIARTRLDGLFYFLDLPEGRYKLVAFLPKNGLSSLSISGQKKERNDPDPFQSKGDKRYGKAQQDATVSYKDGFRKLIVFKLQPTGVMGRVLTSSSKTAVLLAEVRVQGSGERTFTDAQGQYMVAGIQPNARAKRRLLVQARGYRTERLEVMIDEPGACKKIEDIRLTREGG